MKMKVIFRPCCNFAMMGFSEMKLGGKKSQSATRYTLVSDPRHTVLRGTTYVKILRRMEKGMGMTRSMKSAISDTRRRKT